MTFEEIVDQALAMLQRRGRVAYRTLKRQFQLDDEALEDLKVEIIKAQPLAADEDGEVLVWTGAGALASGTAQVKGVSEPVEMYEVAGVGPLSTKLQVAAHRGLAHFVGRQRELEQMQRALELAQGGHGQSVAVVGEPGVGKSRLGYEFKLRAPRDCLVLETFSVSHGKADPYLPLIELLKIGRAHV